MIRVFLSRPNIFATITPSQHFFTHHQLIKATHKRYFSTDQSSNKKHYNNRAYELIPDPQLISIKTKNGKAEKSINDWNSFIYQLKQKNKEANAKK